MASTTTLPVPAPEGTTVSADAPVSELDAARARVAPLLAAFEATHGRPVTLTGDAAVAAGRVVRSIVVARRIQRTP